MCDNATKKTTESRNIVDELYCNAKDLVFNNAYMLIVLGTAFLTYGYYFYFHATGVDDLDTIRFFEEYHLIRQGRFMGQVFHELFDIMKNNVFFTMVVTVALFVCATIFTSAFLKSVTTIKNNLALGVISALMLSFPTNAMIFKFILASALISFGYLLTIFAVVYTMQFINTDNLSTKKVLYALVVLALLVLITSTYESFVFVYFITILFVILFSLRSDSTFYIKHPIRLVFISVSYILVAVIIESIVSNSLIFMLDLEKIERVAFTNSQWFLADSIIRNMKILSFEIFVNYYLVAMYSVSHFYFVILGLAMLIAVVLKTHRKYLALAILVYAALYLSIFGVSIIDGRVQLYRTMQSLSTFVFFASAYVFVSLSKKNVKRCSVIFMAFVVYYSALLQNDYYKGEWNQHLLQNRFIETIMYDIENAYGTNQSIYFVGKYKNTESPMDNAIIRVPKGGLRGRVVGYFVNTFASGKYDSSGNGYYDIAYYPTRSYIDTFGKTSYNSLKVIYLTRYANHLGYDVNVCDVEFLNGDEDVAMSESMEYYPKDGYFKEVNGCVYINIGSY